MVNNGLPNKKNIELLEKSGKSSDFYKSFFCTIKYETHITTVTILTYYLNIYRGFVPMRQAFLIHTYYY